MAESRLAAFIKRLAIGTHISDDPFDDDYFNLAEYLAIQNEEEESGDLGAATIATACWFKKKGLKGNEDFNR